MYKSALWSEKQKTTCVEMAKQGYTSREISAAIGRTKNSIIGYLHRLGIRMSDYNPKGYVKKPSKPAAPRKPRVAKAVEQKKQIRINRIGDISLWDAKTFECRYITHKTDNIWETRCCGQPTLHGSWCETHRKIVFRPKEKAA